MTNQPLQADAKYGLQYISPGAWSISISDVVAKRKCYCPPLSRGPPPSPFTWLHSFEKTLGWQTCKLCVWDMWGVQGCCFESCIIKGLKTSNKSESLFDPRESVTPLPRLLPLVALLSCSSLAMALPYWGSLPLGQHLG